jgi:hypothetical protein
MFQFAMSYLNELYVSLGVLRSLGRNESDNGTNKQYSKTNAITIRRSCENKAYLNKFFHFNLITLTNCCSLMSCRERVIVQTWSMHSCRAVDSCPAQPMGTTLRRCLYITAKIGRISLSRVPTVNIYRPCLH